MGSCIFYSGSWIFYFDPGYSTEPWISLLIYTGAVPGYSARILDILLGVLDILLGVLDILLGVLDILPRSWIFYGTMHFPKELQGVWPGICYQLAGRSTLSPEYSTLGTGYSTSVPATPTDGL